MARILATSLLSILLVAGCATPAASPAPSPVPPTSTPTATPSPSPVATTSPSPSPSASPSFSPAGPLSPLAEHLIAYTNGPDNSSAVRTVRADGQQDRFLAPFADSPAWSPDGRFIAYRCRATNNVSETGGICVMNADGTKSHVVLASAISASWSPDGKRILFSRSPIDAGDTWVANADGSNPQELGPGTGSWSPDGSLVLRLGASGAAPDATVTRPDGTGARALGDCWNAAWSPDGKGLLCTWWDEVHGTLRAIDVATGALTTLFTADTAIGDPAWVTSGVVAFTMTRPGANPSAVPVQNDLYLLDLASGATRKLTSGLSIRGPIKVSSDGAWLAFTVLAGDGTSVPASDVYVASTSGEVRRLTTGGTSREPTWRPLSAPPAASTSRVGLVVLWWSCDSCAFVPGTIVLDDGRVVWQAQMPDGTTLGWGYRVRWLTSEGLAWVRAQLDATGLLAKNASFGPTLVPGATEPAWGPTVNYFQLDRDGKRIEVASADPAGYEQHPDVYRIPPEVRLLATLAASLKDPESWIPASAWATTSAPIPDEALPAVR